MAYKAFSLKNHGYKKLKKYIPAGYTLIILFNIRSYDLYVIGV